MRTQLGALAFILAIVVGGCSKREEEAKRIEIEKKELEVTQKQLAELQAKYEKEAQAKTAGPNIPPRLIEPADAEMMASLKNPQIREQFAQSLEREQHPKPVWIHAVGDGVGAIAHTSRACPDLTKKDGLGYEILKLRETKEGVLIDDIGVAYSWKNAYTLPCIKCSNQ